MGIPLNAQNVVKESTLLSQITLLVMVLAYQSLANNLQLPCMSQTMTLLLMFKP